MRWVKYILICLFSVVIFGLGGAFVFFMPDIRALLHTEKPITTHALELSATTQIPYERYTSTIYFEPSKKLFTEPELSNAESALAPVLAKIMERIGKERSAQDNQNTLCQSQTTPKLRKIPESSPVIESNITCTISAQNLPAYKSMLKEIDYLALKSALLKVKVSAPKPTITQEQAKQATITLREEILGEIESSVAFYTSKTQKSCRLVSSKEISRDLAHFMGAGRAGKAGALMGAPKPNIEPENLGSTTPEDIALPLEQSASVSLGSRVDIACE